MLNPQSTDDQDQLVALFVESVFYGIYLSTLLPCIRALLGTDSGSWHPCSKVGWLLLVATLLLVVSGTLNLALGLVRDIQGLVFKQGPGAIEQLGQDWVNIVKPLCVNVSTLVADATLIYRCWVVCNRSFLVILFPTLLWLVVAACTIVLGHLQVNLQSGSRVSGGLLQTLITVCWAVIIVSNIYTTSMIVNRIWHVYRETRELKSNQCTRPSRNSSLRAVMRIIIESAMAYTTTSVIVFITLVTKSDSFYITTAAVIQLIGINFNLIIVRTTDERRKEERGMGTRRSTTFGFNHPTSMHGDTNNRRDDESDGTLDVCAERGRVQCDGEQK